LKDSINNHFTNSASIAGVQRMQIVEVRIVLQLIR